MNGKLTDADFIVLIAALANRLNHTDTTVSRSDVSILLEHLAQTPDLDPIEDVAVFLARHELFRGLYRGSAMRICNAFSRRMSRMH
jgi:hypothetical protein